MTAPTGSIVTTIIDSPVGLLRLGATERAICLLEFVDHRQKGSGANLGVRRFGHTIPPGKNRLLARLREELASYFTGGLRRFSVPLDYPGTPFQMAVWNRLRRIPWGQTISYEQLAIDIGHPRAFRAVGTANGSNRIAIVIPCHRVVNKNGALGGYGGGLWRKKILLELEQRPVGK